MFLFNRLFRKTNPEKQWFCETLCKVIDIPFPQDLTVSDTIKLVILAYENEMFKFANNGFNHLKKLIKETNSHVEAMRIIQSIKTHNKMNTDIKEFVIAECAVNKDVYDQVCSKNDQISHENLVEALMNSDSLSMTTAMIKHIMPFTEKDKLQSLILKYDCPMTMKDHPDYYQQMYPEKYEFYNALVPICSKILERYVYLLTSYVESESYTSLDYQYLDELNYIDVKYTDIHNITKPKFEELKDVKIEQKPQPKIDNTSMKVTLEQLSEDRQNDLKKISQWIPVFNGKDFNNLSCTVDDIVQVNDTIYKVKLFSDSTKEITLKLNEIDVMKLVLNQGVIVDEQKFFTLMTNVLISESEKQLDVKEFVCK